MLRVLELEPEHGAANLAIAEDYIKNGQYHEALPHMQKAVAASPLRVGVRLRLGYVYEKIGNTDRALAEYRGGRN